MTNKERSEYKTVLNRDNYTCQLCYKPYAHIHHVQYRSLQGITHRKNMICLCKSCHDLVHKKTDIYKPLLLDKLRFHYGVIDIEDLKKKSKYADFKFSK